MSKNYEKLFFQIRQFLFAPRAHVKIMVYVMKKRTKVNQSIYAYVRLDMPVRIARLTLAMI